MPKNTLTFSAYSDTLAPGSGDAWGPSNSTPAFPSGYTLAGDPPRISSGRLTKYSGTGNTVVLDDTVLSGNVIAVEGVLGPVGSDSQFLALCSPSGSGYQILVNSTNIRCFAMTSFVLGLQVGASISFVATSGHLCRVERNNTTGVMSVYTGVDSASLALRGSVTQSNANTDWRAAVGTRNSASIASLVSDYTAAQTITSINSGNPITVGQTGVVIAHTGFTGAITSVTTNRSGVTCAITAGDANSTTVTVSGWVEGGAYPVVDNTVTFTCTRGSESASATQTLTKPANYAQVTFSGAITDDPNLIGYHLAANGHTVEGGTFYNRTDQVPTLTVNADTSWTSDPAGGTFSATFIPSSGATSGNAYLFDITLLNGSIVSVQGLTSVGLTSTGLTQIGLTSVGLC